MPAKTFSSFLESLALKVIHDDMDVYQLQKGNAACRMDLLLATVSANSTTGERALAFRDARGPGMEQVAPSS